MTASLRVYLCIALAACVASAPAGQDASSLASAPPASATDPPASDNPNYPLWSENSPGTPEAIRGQLGAIVIGPQNVPVDKQNPDLLAPPTTDAGSIQNAKWPFGLSHNRLQSGGWARQQNLDVMPIATQMAGVDMRLEAGAIRELHWHLTGEWGYVLKGSCQVSAVNPDGQNYMATVGTGDLWYFPAGTPHSLQGTDDDPDGTEFLLVFDSGTFSEDSTFLLTDWLAHTPKEVIAKNFQASIPDFDKIPSEQLYIFPSTPPEDDAQPPQSPQGTASTPYTFSLSNMTATPLSGGSVKVVDSTIFPASTTIAVGDVTVEPGAMRELHWHPTQDEWDYFIEGTGRITIFGSSGNARTFNYQPGDIGYVPASYGHYVENTGNTTLHFLEIFKTDRYQDVSLSQWLALSPPQVVQAHLGLSDEMMARLANFRTKQVVIGPAGPK